MSEIVIKEITSKKELKKMLHLPWSLYKNDKNWIAPLKMALNDIFSPKHPFYETSRICSWMAFKDDKAIGRVIAVINDRHNEFHNEKQGFFGFFECIDDQFVADTLLETAEKWLKDNK